jgi:hypothetical protein
MQPHVSCGSASSGGWATIMGQRRPPGALGLGLTLLLLVARAPGSSAAVVNPPSHLRTLEHIKVKGHITAHELLDHLSEVLAIP